MAAGYNRVILIGNLTRDPEYKQLTSGQAVCRLGLATNRQFKNRQTGDMVQEVCYVDIDVWGQQAESCRQYLAKGRSILVEGRLKLDTWQDQEGQNRSKLFVVADRVTFLSAAQADQASPVAVASSDTTMSSNATENTELGKEIMGKLDELKTKQGSEVKPAKKAASQKTDEPAKAPAQTGEIDFQDSPPFQDDLPF